MLSENENTDIFLQNKSAVSARVFNLDKNDKIVFLQHGFVRIWLNFAHGSLLLGSDINSNR